MRVTGYPKQTNLATAKDAQAPPASCPQDKAGLRPEILAEARFLHRLGFSKPLISTLVIRAMRRGTSVEAQLLASGHAVPETYYEALAEKLGLPFIAAVDASRIRDIDGSDFQLLHPTVARLQFAARPPLTVIVPSARTFEPLLERLDHEPALRRVLAVTHPKALRAAIWQSGRLRRVKETVNRLFDAMPQFSARVTFSGRQGFYAGFAPSLLLVFAIFHPVGALLLLHFTITTLFLAALMIRLVALVRFGRVIRQSLPDLPAGPHPVYSVFVALYREADVAPQLVEMLDRIHWPRDRLDIKLICEEDDAETLAALRALPLGPEYEIVEVPPFHPRTKPKALAYALPAARGDYLVIYDAEDRPHPGQIEEAWSRFAVASDDLVCLQAPLIITNARASWISALFALEYAALFRRLLPMLAASRLPMPLGGTSNHFRVAALRESGGWDPFNVTEDADLGMRLYRLGFRCGVLTRPTLEDAPTDIRTWLGQRTRWFKGWLQTWLVLMRRPGGLMREMGLLPAIVFQVLIGGLIFSSLVHPLVIAYVLLVIAQMMADGAHSPGPLALTLFVIDTVNIVGSYAVFVALGHAPMSRVERATVGRRWMLVGCYWILISVAAWQAVGELRSNPFFWNKTAHRPTPLRERLANPAATAGLRRTL